MNPMRRMGIWAGRIGLGRKLAIALAIPALASGIATYLALTGAPPFGPHPSAVLGLLYLDYQLVLVPLFLVPILVSRQAFSSYLALKRSHEATVRILVGAL